jgi:hypothetical protein
VPNQDCMVDVEEFPSPRISRDSRLWQHCEVDRVLLCKRRTPSPLVNNPGLLRRIAFLSLFKSLLMSRLNALLLMSTFQCCLHLETTALSVHVIWGGDYYCYPVVNISTNWTHACQRNAGILSAGIK